MRENQLLDKTADTQTTGQDTVTSGFGELKGNSISQSSYDILSGNFMPTPITDDLLAKAKEIVSQKSIIESLIKKSEPGGEGNTSLVGDAETRGENMRQWRQNILDNYNELVQTTADQVFDLETEVGYNQRAQTHSDLMEYSEIGDVRQNFRDDKKQNRKNYKGKERRERKRDLRLQKKAEIKNIKARYDNTEVDKIDDPSTEMIGSAPRKNYIGTTAYRPAFDMPQYGKVIDPQRDFKFEYKNKFYEFCFAAITLDDIMPLVTPRAKDSVVDKAPDIKDKKSTYFSQIKNLDEEVKTLTGNHTEIIKQQDALYEGTVNNTFNGNKDKARSEWEKEQAKLETDTLTEEYTSLYQFKTNEGDWKYDYSDKQKTPETSGYESDGKALDETRRNLYEWLAFNTPANVDGSPTKWDSTDKKFVSGTGKAKNPIEYENHEKYQGAINKYDTEEKKAQLLNDLIGGGGKNAEIYGWNVDALKLKLMVGISKDLINPQKWSTDLETSDDKITDEYYKAGRLKKTANDKKDEKDKVNNIGTTRSFTEGVGTYKQTESKRYGGYDETTGEYLNKPVNSDPVDEKLIWMVNYKLHVDEDTNKN